MLNCPMMAPKLHPLAEVFGFPTDNLSDDAIRHRNKKLCPFNNKVPNCTKDKANDPLGVCSVFEKDHLAVTCPIRFRQDWIIADDAADFFFPEKAKWTSLTEVRLKDKFGKSAGNIDLVLVSYDDKGTILDFGALLIQEPYSRERLAPRLIVKGGTKTAVALDAGLFATLPKLAEVPREKAKVAWLVYDVKLRKSDNRYILRRRQTVYSDFGSALDTIGSSEPGESKDLIDVLRWKLDERLGNGTPPDTQTVDQLF